MAITYPNTLPDFLISKSRKEQQQFRTAQPFSGPLYIEKVTDDTPVLWDVRIRCTSQIQLRQFQAFLRQVKQGQVFTKDIWTEEGNVSHEVRFIEVPLTPKQVNNYIWEYSGTIYATKLIQNDAGIDDELIYTWLQDAEIIDTAMNQLWAE